jgi:hypothetical protein
MMKKLIPYNTPQISTKMLVKIFKFNFHLRNGKKIND